MSGYVNKKFEVVGDLVLSGSSVSDVFEPKDSPPPIRTIITEGATLTGATVTVPALIQNLTLDGTEIEISGGNTIDIADAIPEMDTQLLTLSGTDLSIERGNTVDLSSFYQTMSLLNNQLSITNGNTIDLNVYSQTLSLTGTELTISDGNTVDLTSFLDNVDEQLLSLSGTELTISKGNTVDLATFLDNVDEQTLSLNGTELTISGGNTIDLAAMKQTLSLSGTELAISDGNTVDLAAFLDNLDEQTLTLSGTELTISNGNTVDLAAFLDNLDEQTLSLSGTVLTISNGNTVDLAAMKQTLVLSGTELSISDGNAVDLSSFLDNVDEQTLSLSGTELTISKGNTIDLASLSQDIDNQTLSLSGNTLTISNGNAIDLSTLQSETIAPIFITNITNNNGLIDKQYMSDTVPSNYIISGVTVDDDSNLDVTIEWDGPDDDWMGDAYINGDIVPTNAISRIGDTRRFRSTINVDLEGTETITVSANGGTYQVPVTLLGGGPAITDVAFSALPTYGGHQQAAFFDGDSVQITFTFDTEDVTSISLQGGNGTATSTINNQNITPTAVGDGTSTFTLTTTIDTSLSSTTQVPVIISAKNSFGTEGDTHTSVATIPVRQGPAITNVTFGAYPGSQTELKDNDTITATFEFDSNNVSQVQLASGSSYASSSQTRSVTTTNLSATTTITIDTSVTSAQNQPVRARARASNYGNYSNSTNTVVVNNVGPTYSGWSVSYPTNQSAIKEDELAVVRLTISNVGNSPTYTYSNPRNEITIPDTSVYSVAKNTTGTSSGNYNISSNNFSVSVNRAENNKTTSYSNVVKIVDTLPSISVSSPSNMRSGGAENTSPQTYQITVTSNQQLESFDLAATPGAGTLQGAWNGSNSNRTWRRNIQISDADSKGTHDWINLTALNLSNVTQTNISSGGTYTLAGFVPRTLTMSALSRTRALGTNVQDPTKLSISETFRGSITFDTSIADGTTIDADISSGIDVANKYTIVNSSNLSVVDYNGDTFFYLDRVAVNNNVSGTSVITVEETA